MGVAATLPELSEWTLIGLGFYLIRGKLQLHQTSVNIIYSFKSRDNCSS